MTTAAKIQTCTTVRETIRPMSAIASPGRLPPRPADGVVGQS